VRQSPERQLADPLVEVLRTGCSSRERLIPSRWLSKFCWAFAWQFLIKAPGKILNQHKLFFVSCTKAMLICKLVHS
jgi:hypothetical protein